MNFGRAWAGNGCRKCFDFSCQTPISNRIAVQSKFNEFARIRVLTNTHYDSSDSPPSCRDFLALCDRARRSASEVLQGLLNLSCFVHDLVNRNINDFDHWISIEFFDLFLEI